MLAKPSVFLVPKESIRTSKELTASLFFIAVFGDTKAVTALSALVAVSSFGNILAVIIGSSRIIRECGRYVRLFSVLYIRVIYCCLTKDRVFCRTLDSGHRPSHLTRL